MAKPTEQELKGIFEKCSNWGRWGKDDERGALNFITAQKRAAAAKLVQTGEAVSLALPLATIPAPDNPTPVMHLVQQAGHDSHDLPLLPYAADYFAIAPHGVANTHLDALCHVFYQGKMYNGFDASEVGSQGAKKCAIDVTRGGVISRGILLDIPKIKKVEWLENGTPISANDLDDAAKDHRVNVEEGDVLLFALDVPSGARPKADGMHCMKGWPDLIPARFPGFTNTKSQYLARTASAMWSRAVSISSHCRSTSARS